jgi:hypothetical protein
MNQKERRRRARQKKRRQAEGQPQVPANHRCNRVMFNRCPSLDHTQDTEQGEVKFQGFHCPVCQKKYVHMRWKRDDTEYSEWRSVVKFDGRGNPVLA